MKRSIAALCTALSLSLLLAGGAHAWPNPVDDYEPSESHPLRLLAYAVHPIGYALEWLVARPIHAFVADPSMQDIFGHRPHVEEGYR